MGQRWLVQSPLGRLAWVIWLVLTCAAQVVIALVLGTVYVLAECGRVSRSRRGG